MTLPAARHGKRHKPSASALVWLGGEPYRLFFLSGILFSIAGVALWPLFYRGMLPFYPGVSHARIMIEAFGGGFVIGFLGTAGPRILSAPKLKPWELVPLFALHLCNGIAHLRGLNRWGDGFFLILLIAFASCLAVRFVWFRKDLPPPPLLLAAVGMLCGIAGTLLWLNPAWMTSMAGYRLAGLLLYQGFLLGPVMGVGIFLFPRLLGNAFGEPEPGPPTRRAWRQMIAVAAALVASFAIEAWGHPTAGMLLRAAAFGFALANVRWIRATGSGKAGTLANALRVWSIPLAMAGLIGAAFFQTRRIAFDHLLFIGGFGLLCLIAGSRVLFGHSGSVERFANRSWIARAIVFGAVIAAMTRFSADFLPSVMISHYEYAAVSWGGGALVWALWHAPRFFKKDDSPM